jgi:hypothetical protein
VSIPLAVPKGVGVLLQRAPDELSLLPKVGSQEAIGVGNSSEGSLKSILEGLGAAGRRGVGVFDTGELEQALHSRRSDQGGTARSGDELGETN